MSLQRLFALATRVRIRTIGPILYGSYLGTRLEETANVNCSTGSLADTEALDLVTVAFNNPTILQEQIRLLTKNLTDAFQLTVGDNSPDESLRRGNRRVCEEAGVAYIDLPRDPFRGNPSKSHGAALTWLYRNYVVRRNAPYFGTLDHDIFPVRQTSILRLLRGRQVYGLLGENTHTAAPEEDHWYLWPGFSFFETRYLSGEKVDFMPVQSEQLDTGGANWKLFAELDRPLVTVADQRFEHVRPGDDKQACLVGYVGGDWLHTINASYWKPMPAKESLIGDLLRTLGD